MKQRLQHLAENFPRAAQFYRSTRIRKTRKYFAQKFPRIARFCHNNLELLDRNSSAVKTSWGFSLAGNSMMASGLFEPEETQLIRGLLQEVECVINIGANVGYYCCHALSLGKSVIAVEPIDRNLHYLKRNMVENNWGQQIEIYPVALGSKTDVQKIWGSDTAASLIRGWAGIPESYVTQVPVLTLDRILGSSIASKKTLILVDIEGAEYGMLQGAVNTLVHVPRPIWMVEIGTTMHQPIGTIINPHLVETFRMFFERGYLAQSADADQLTVDMALVKSVARGEATFNSHNFIFR